MRNFQGWAPVVLIDNFSSDRTVEIARRFTDRIVMHRNPGWGDPESYQVRFTAAPTDYVLIAYAGQYYPPSLLELYKKIAKEGHYKAVAVWNQVYSYGRAVNSYGRPFVNNTGAFAFFRKSAIDLNLGKIHSELPFTGSKEEIYYPPKLPEFCRISFRDDDCASTELKHARYADADARQQHSAGVRTNLLIMTCTYLRHLLGCLLWRGAIWQGMPGIINSIWRANYYLSIHIRIWEMQNGYEQTKITSLHAGIRSKLSKREQIDVINT